MDRQIENLKREISFLEQQLVNLKMKKNKFESELSIGKSNLLALEREAREIKKEWD